MRASPHDWPRRRRSARRLGGWRLPRTRSAPGRRLALIGLGLVAVVAIGAGVVTASYMQSLSDSYQKRDVVSITRGPSDGERPEHVDGTGRNFLLLGSDKRSEEDAASEGVSGERSDVMMLVHVDRKSVV